MMKDLTILAPLVIVLLIVVGFNAGTRKSASGTYKPTKEKGLIHLRKTDDRDLWIRPAAISAWAVWKEHPIGNPAVVIRVSGHEYRLDTETAQQAETLGRFFVNSIGE